MTHTQCSRRGGIYANPTAASANERRVGGGLQMKDEYVGLAWWVHPNWGFKSGMLTPWHAIPCAHAHTHLATMAACLSSHCW
jgi:hypothetical protein